MFAAHLLRTRVLALSIHKVPARELEKNTQAKKKVVKHGKNIYVYKYFPA